MNAFIKKSLADNLKLMNGLITVGKNVGHGKKVFLAKVHASEVPNAAKVVIKKLEFDENLNMYFPKFYPYYAHDPNKLCKVGDIAMIELLPKQLTRDITHKIIQVIYPMGDVKDPITGKPCVAGEFREDMERKDQLWGKNESAFDYDSAPERGWQEGRNDWSHKPGHKRWHEFNAADHVDQEEAQWP